MIPISQAIMWRSFRCGSAARPWRVGYRIMMARSSAPPSAAGIADNWSWLESSTSTCRSCARLLAASAFLFDPAHIRRPAPSTPSGSPLMVIGFGAMQYVLDAAERRGLVRLRWIVGLTVLAVCALAGSSRAR